MRHAAESDAMNQVDKPDAGNPHVRFDEGEQRVGHKPPVALYSTGSVVKSEENACRSTPWLDRRGEAEHRVQLKLVGAASSDKGSTRAIACSEVRPRTSAASIKEEFLCSITSRSNQTSLIFP